MGESPTESTGHGKTDISFFQIACQDLARLTSLVAFDSDDVIKPRFLQSRWQNFLDQLTFFLKQGYLTVMGGFVPYYFRLLPFKLYQLHTVLNSLVRKLLLSWILRLMGHGRHCAWSGGEKDGDAKAPASPYTSVTALSLAPGSQEAMPYAAIPVAAFGVKGRLAQLQMQDEELSSMCAVLTAKGAVLAPHSQASINPLTMLQQMFFTQKFPGNFFDHLSGVWKALAAWQQPQYVCRAGFFHSVYGTNQYRAGLWTYDQRDEVRTLIGPAAEQIAFLICTAERNDLCVELCAQMYNAGKAFTGIKNFAARKALEEYYAADGRRRMTQRLGEEGLPLTNHVTGQKHQVAPRVLAHFVIVMMADFMEQGVSSIGFYEDDDILLFQFLRLGFWMDVVKFISPYLDVIPPVLQRYGLLDGMVVEPTRHEIATLKRVWLQHTLPTTTTTTAATATATHPPLSDEDLEALKDMEERFPWMPEVKIMLAAALMDAGEGEKASSLADEGLECLCAWGMLHNKDIGHNRDAVRVVQCLQRKAK